MWTYIYRFLSELVPTVSELYLMSCFYSSLMRYNMQLFLLYTGDTCTRGPMGSFKAFKGIEVIGISQHWD